MTADEKYAALAEPTVSVETAGKILEIGICTAYRCVKLGQIPVIRLGRQMRVPTVKLREMLSIEAA